MATVTTPETPVTPAPATATPSAPADAPITVTQKAAEQVKKFIAQQQAAGQMPEKVYLRVRVLGGGCSGLQDKLDLDANYNEKLDELYDFYGTPVVVDKRSLMYLQGAVIDFHDELHRSGFSIHNPNRKSQCGCGSSYTM
jgi:iron-sulfur cluster assembly accessory protein